MNLIKIINFIRESKKSSKCPTGYKWSKTYNQCVPKKGWKIVGSHWGLRNRNEEDDESKKKNGNGNGSSGNGHNNGGSGNGNGGNGNGGNGNGGSNGGGGE
jgi:hypothetical protein